MTRLERYDFASTLELVERLDAPTPERAPAVKTGAGYLHVRALIARDGLLTYSDGTDTWLEYRPREALEAAASTWEHAPVTDEHPPRMVTAETWAEVARGFHVGPVTTVDDGLACYLQADLLITDAELVRVLESGEKREVSIGFTSNVVPAPETAHYDAVQTELVGNHTAIVSKGRAGPSVRVLMDGAAYLVSDDAMKPINKRPPKTDAAGSPVETVSIQGPDGNAYELPTWVVAMLEELQAMKQAQAQAPAADQEQQAQAPAPAPAPPAPRPDEGGELERPDEASESAEKMDAAAVTRAVRRRARLERYAAKAGLADEKIDALDDDDALTREVVRARGVKHPRLDSLKGEALAALLELEPAPKTEDKDAPKVAPAPWKITTKNDAADDEDPVDAMVASALEKQGYGA